MSQELLPAVEIKPKGEHKATIIWLHGLGDSGNGFAPIAPELKLPDNLGVKFLFPHAPIRPVTINNGMEMRAWYDIKSMDMDSRADLEGVIDSAQRVEQLIRAEIESGIDASKIMLVGFSQGGVIALHLGARFTQTLAGIVALSTYMCAPQSLSAEKSAENQNTPVFFAHGQQDEV
eukprot:CAMPEP_0182897500 /NCGR_PEP_ID=MMETSP0034_2-20130328/26925_1 /TAXON_ID=156128 /ORGANISM="Nephroselmis pyriformis, Strain CCMP717" /LENGTH=175 /DNA_ID=CAMNT_0025031423 /DNA_START=284 /DNA_END=807 /DNA_ORIENTATION=+